MQLSMIKYLTTVLLFITMTAVAQTNSLTGSPYSIFGVGVPSTSYSGAAAGIAGTGKAYSTLGLLNFNNPANVLNIPTDQFFLDLGGSFELNRLQNRTDSENRFNSNFSNFSMGVNAGEKWAFGVNLIPYTNVGYSLIGIEREIEGSTDIFISNTTGSGGIYDISFDVGYRLFPWAKLGLRTSYYFGTISQEENIIAQPSLLTITDEQRYSGLSFETGLQLVLNKKKHLGFTVQLPTTLFNNTSRSITNTQNFGISDLIEEEVDGRDFSLPLVLGAGYTTFLLKDKLQLNIEYEFSNWEENTSVDFTTQYRQQQRYSAGMTYYNKKEKLNYWDNVQYRGGLFYDTGYLQVSDDNLSSYGLSAGIGFPIGRGGSMFNISLTRGRTGEVKNFLIQEDYTRLNFNLSLRDLWFQKRKYK